MHHTTISSPISLQDHQYPTRPGNRASAPALRHQSNQSIDRIWPPALDLKLSQITHRKNMVDMDVGVERRGEDDVGNGGVGGRLPYHHKNNNRRAHYHLPGVYPLNPERTKDLFDMEIDADTDTEADTTTVSKRSKRPWPWTSASASSAASTHSPSTERYQEKSADGQFTVQYLRHSKSWTCLSDINRLAMAQVSSSEDESEEKNQETSCPRLPESYRKDKECDNEINKNINNNNNNNNNNNALSDKTPQQQEERAKLDESDRKMLAAQSILQWQNNTNQSTDNPNYTQSISSNSTSTSTTIFPHKTITTTIVAINDISTGRPTYTATTTTFSSAVDDISTNRSTPPTRPFPPFATRPIDRTTTATTTTADDISCYRPSRSTPAPIRVTTAIASTEDISCNPIRPTARTDDMSSRPSRPNPTTDDISTYRPTRPMPTTDDISSRPSRQIPAVDDISSRCSRPAPRTDDISSRPTRPITTTTDDISSRPSRPAPRIDDISSRPSHPTTDNISTFTTTARTASKTDEISSRPTRSFHPFATTSTTTTASLSFTAADDISCCRPTARLPMRPQFLAFTPIIDDNGMDTTTTTSMLSVSYESSTTPPPPSSNSPHLSIPSPGSSGGRFSPYYYSQLSPYSRAAGAVSPLPARRCSADTSIQMCILQGFLDRHSNGHIMYPKPKPSKCCSLSGSCSSGSGSGSGSEEDEDMEYSSSNGSSSSPTSFSDAESDQEDQEDQEEEDIDEEDEEFQNRMLLLSQSPNLSSVDFRRDFFMTERQATANTRQADSPVFFQGFPLLNMTRIE